MVRCPVKLLAVSSLRLGDDGEVLTIFHTGGNQPAISSEFFRILDWAGLVSETAEASRLVKGFSSKRCSCCFFFPITTYLSFFRLTPPQVHRQ